MAGDDEPLADRPEPDKLVRAVAKARVAEKLFATKEIVRVGRYHLLEMVGEGGMGVVWGAWDPELERRVALKLLTATSIGSRERILAEGQALAKLSHPNVVPIYDVGVHDEQVYLVMEWVRGENLRAWASEPRSARDIVAVYREAGAGLEAAHAAGLIHRDFKPENAVVGEDGRVRVLDFGLARSEAEGDGAGTPRYMAPEQKAGGAVTTAVDQFAFGVSLRESIAVHGDVPRWIEAIVTRATAAAPADRFPSMVELLAALARDPRTVWTRRALVVAVLGLAGSAFAIGTWRSDGIEPCSGGVAQIAGAWSSPLHARVEGHLRSLGPYGVEIAAKLGDELDAYARIWATAHRGACVASEAGELPRARYEDVLGCLARSRASLSAAADVLGASDLARLPDAVLAAHSLPDPHACRLGAEMSTVAPPSAMLAPRVAELGNDVARARVLALAQDPRAISVAESTVRAADQLGYAPLVGRALLANGFALLYNTERNHESIAILERAYATAFAANDRRTAIEAYARELYVITISLGALPPSAEATVAGAKVAESVARGLDPTGAFARALLFNNLGTLRLSRGDTAGARSWFAAAFKERPPVVGETYEMASIAGNLGIVEDDPAKRLAYFEQERSELATVVGEDHPLTLESRGKTAAFGTDPAATRAELRATCEQVQRLHPHLAERFSSVAYDLVWLAFDAGDAATARTASAWITLDRTHATLAAAYVALLDDRTADATALARASLVVSAAMQSPWMQWRSLDALYVLALVEQRAGHREALRAHVDSALALAEKLPGFAKTLFYQQRVARLRALKDSH